MSSWETQTIVATSAGIGALVPLAVIAAAKAFPNVFGVKDDSRMKLLQQQHQAMIVEITAGKGKISVEEAAEAYKKYLVKMREEYPPPKFLPDDNIPTIGVMGESGVGKSTFINSILGEKVATTGFGERTMKPALYPWGDVRLVDLPGGCTTRFKAEEYLQEFGIRYFDTIVILSSDATIKQLAMDAVEHLTRNGIPTMFVLSKIETVVQGEASAKEVSPEEVMHQVLEDMEKMFTEALSNYNCPVYLISAVEVKQECGSLERIPRRLLPLSHPINKDWLPLLQSMRVQAIDRKSFLSRAK